MGVRTYRERGLPDGTYVELVRSLFLTLVSTTIIVARLGGDEFVMFQTSVSHPDEAKLMARRIVRAVGDQYEVAGHCISIGVSLGYAIPEGCGHDLPNLLGCADLALYRVKRNGGGAAAYGEVSDRAKVASA